MTRRARAAALAWVTCLLLLGCNREYQNPSDPDADRFTVDSKAFLRRLDSASLIEGDTLRMYGGVTSRPVADDGLVVEYAWDRDGDGLADTVTQTADTLALPLSRSGDGKIGLTLTDQAGLRSSATLDYKVHPALAWQFRLAKLDSGCPAYAQEPVLMRLALAVSQFSIEKTKEEGLENTEFALKIARALTGTAYPIGLLDGFDYSFANGVYHFQNGTFQIDVAFHYGPGMVGHAEGDTLKADLFDLDSYVRITDVTLIPPSVKYKTGPLADLIDGTIAVNTDDIRHPRFDFQVDFNRLRISFFRSTRTLLVLSNQEITLANALFFTLYEGRARLAPTYPPELIRLYGKDSLALDFSGTRISSPELPIRWPYADNGRQDTAVYRLALVQETLRQIYRFGDADGVNKVWGDYAAVNHLGMNPTLEAVYFQGDYSSTAPDSARFYCDETMTAPSQFGTAAFETDVTGQADFQSDRYGYAFHFPFSTVEPWSGSPDALPTALRGWDGGYKK